MKIELKKWLKDHPKMKKFLEDFDLSDIFIYGGKFDESRGNSLFYNGEVYTFKYKDRILSLIACGEIRIFKDGELIFDGKERNNGFGFEVKNDIDLEKVNEENGFIFENNNWFECEFKKENDEYYDNILGDVFYDMEESFGNIILWLKDDEWWNK